MDRPHRQSKVARTVKAKYLQRGDLIRDGRRDVVVCRIWSSPGKKVNVGWGDGFITFDADQDVTVYV